ncbi:MAG: phenylalanine--tRNA ligase subunit beta, partial [Anaeroplasmataceae bacterium]
IISVIKMISKDKLIDYSVFDIYEGENINSDEKSIAYKLVFNDSTKTLETADIDKLVSSIINRLGVLLNAYIRT